MENVHHNENTQYKRTAKPVVQRVPMNAALKWLGQGAKDLASAPFVGIGYGILFALLSLAATYVGITQPRLALTFFTVLVLIGPFLATGLYKTAKRKDQGEPASSKSSLLPSKKQISQLAVYVGIMLLLAVAWIRITTIAVALYLSQASPGEEILISLISSSDGLYFLGLLSMSIILFTLLVFALSTLGLPMIIDGRAEAIPAMIMSIKTVFNQPAAMLVWALLIAILTIVGVATLFIGLVFIFPLLGYATWHSYKDIIK